MISVVIPTYNCGPYLRESLDSIFAQGVADLEVVVVDDGSTDDTPKILRDYGERIRVVAGRHEGLSAARNLGLAEARGEWIAFHDADDVALPDRLQHAVTFLRDHPAFDAVFADGERMDGGGRLIPPAFFPATAGRRLDARDLFAGFPVYFQGALAPRRAFEAAGAWDPTLRVQPDIEYGYRLFRHCRPALVDRVVFSYRWHTTNNSRDRLGGRRDIARILDQLQVDDPTTVREIGAQRLRARLARHYYRIARALFTRGDVEDARFAAARAVRLRPLNLRYRWLQLFPPPPSGSPSIT